MRSGFVYILGNPGLSAYKIGQTTRTAELRSVELRREYGTAHPFEVVSRHAVENPAAVEALAHRILSRHRVPRSELFAADLATCQRAVMAAAVLVLDRPWWLRLWHWVTLPRPAPRRRYRRSQGASGAELLAFLALVGVVVALVMLKPDLPAWVPASMLRTAYMLEHLRR